jgi:hypothetical protein
MPRVYVPCDVQLNFRGSTVKLTQGLQTISDDLLNHWWLKENGVTAIRPL